MAQTIQKTLLKAQTLARKGEAAAAAELYNSVLARFPGNRTAQDGLKELSATAPASPPSRNAVLAQDRDFVTLVNLFNQGQFDQAKPLAEQIMARPGGHAEAANILGAINTKQGDHAAAIDTYTKALQANPSYAEAYYNLGKAQVAVEDLVSARESYEKAIDLKPDFVQAHFNLGNLLNRTGHPQPAAAQYEETLKLNPDYAEAHYNLGNMRAQLGQHEAALESFTRALELKPDYTQARVNLGSALNKLNRPAEAMPHLRRAIEQEPENVDAQTNLGHALNLLGRYEDAKEMLDQALDRDPDRIDALNHMGSVATTLGEDEEAVRCYTRILELVPDNLDAYVNLCELYEKRNNHAAFRETLKRAMQHCSPDNPAILFRRAQQAVHEKNDTEAEALLDQIKDEDLHVLFRAARTNLLAKICDRLGKYDKAFENFRASNKTFSELPASRVHDPEAYFKLVQDLQDAWSSARPKGWTTPPMPEGAPRMAFLVGFPRSGTTLLDTILRSHPDIEVVEEQPMINHTRRALGCLDSPQALNQVSEDHLLKLREAYMSELDKHLDPGTSPQVVVDKFPLGTVNAGLIQRIFPDARFILALRHPCDVVLSCYMQNFDPNPAMTNFSDLERSARLYDLVMTLWHIYLARMPLKVQRVYYEDLIQDLRGSAEPVLNLLDLEWDDNLANYQETAKSRKRIHTASYNQVTEKLYTRASGRWKRYEKHMAPALPWLLPWAKRFGYD